VKKVIEVFDKMFLRADQMRRLQYKEEYNTFKFDEADRDINAQFVRYEELIDKCVELGVTIEEDQNKADYFCMSLPLPYRDLISTYISLHNLPYLPYLEAKPLIVEKWERDAVNKDDRRARKLAKEEKEEEGRQEKALVSKPATTQPTSSKEEKNANGGGGAQELICFNCEQRGHYAHDCLSLLTPAGINAINEYRARKSASTSSGKGSTPTGLVAFPKDEREEPPLGFDMGKKHVAFLAQPYRHLHRGETQSTANTSS